MQGFVGEIGHHQSERLYENVQVVQTSCTWRRDSTQYLMKTFQSFVNGIKVSYRNAASEIYSEFIYLIC